MHIVYAYIVKKEKEEAADVKSRYYKTSGANYIWYSSCSILTLGMFFSSFPITEIYIFAKWDNCQVLLSAAESAELLNFVVAYVVGVV